MTRSEFFGNSALTEESKQEICDWFNALPLAQKGFVKDLQADARAATQFENDEDESV